MDLQRIVNISVALARHAPNRCFEARDINQVLLVSGILYVYDPAGIRRMFARPEDIAHIADEYDQEAGSIVLHAMEHGHGQDFPEAVKAVFDRAFGEDYDLTPCRASAVSIAAALETDRAVFDETVLAALEPGNPVVIYVDGDKDLSDEATRQENSQAEDGASWIGVDLDGTLAEYNGWRGFNHIGRAVPAMLERVQTWLAEGRRIKIFTARAQAGEYACWPLRRWLHDQGLPELEITNIKDFHMTELWDDRCVRVEHNTGKVPGYETNEDPRV